MLDVKLGVFDMGESINCSALVGFAEAADIWARYRGSALAQALNI